MSEKLSEENRALLTGELAVLKFGVMTSDGPQNYYEMPESTLNRLLNAARAEARPAVDREAVARELWNLATGCEPGEAWAWEKAIWIAAFWPEAFSCRDLVSKCFQATDAILALLSPATSPGEGSSSAESARTGTLPVLTEGQHSAGGGKIPGVEEVIRYLRNYGPGTPDTTDLYFMRWAADHLCNLVSREAFWRSQAQTSEAG